MTDTARSNAISRYSERRPESASALDFFARLWDLQDEIAEAAPDWETPSDEDARAAIGRHQTLFSLGAPQIDDAVFADAASRVASLLADDGGLGPEDAEALRSLDFAELLEKGEAQRVIDELDVLATDITTRAAEKGIAVPTSTVSFVLMNAATPLLRAAAKSAIGALGTAFDWTLWDSGLCPVCGTPASSGWVADEGELKGGERLLSCPLCRASWGFTRVRCARCGERDHSKLEYLFDEEDPGHRIHTCKTCHGYVKVAFEREVGMGIRPPVEEVVMLPLDRVAESRGYTPLGDQDEESAN